MGELNCTLQLVHDANAGFSFTRQSCSMLLSHVTWQPTMVDLTVPPSSHGPAVLLFNIKLKFCRLWMGTKTVTDEEWKHQEDENGNAHLKILF